MTIFRKPPHELLLSNFESAAIIFRNAIKLRGISPAHAEKEVERARFDLRAAGALVRRMQLTPEQRDAAVARLEKLSKWLKPLMAANKYSIMGERWITTIIRRVGSQ